MGTEGAPSMGLQVHDIYCLPVQQMSCSWIYGHGKDSLRLAASFLWLAQAAIAIPVMLVHIANSHDIYLSQEQTCGVWRLVHTHLPRTYPVKLPSSFLTLVSGYIRALPDQVC